MNFNEYKDIYVFCEQRGGVIQEVSFELLGEARKLVEQIEHVEFNVVAVLLGNDIRNQSNDLIAHGADRVIVAEHELLKNYSTEAYTKTLVNMICDYKPDSFLVGATVIGRDLAPRVAARCDTGLTADATILEVDPEQENSTLLWVTRPAFGGNLFGTIICPDHRPQMATIRPKVLEPLDRDESRVGEIIDYNIDLSETDIKTKVIDVIEKIKDAVDITKSDVIVSGGRGIGQNFHILKEVANELEGVVGASRAAVDEGYATKDMQVGQTGQTVRPKLYIACGISGAVQHIAGMEKSDFIIAINKDPQAAIFDVANVGIVGDAIEILPKLKDELKALRK
ncbi:electron transfer flavoprotein subunit alpha/FixB family protein [Haloplasma contractile]|uniref:Electron transfer flavoprotein alpha-subunit n=1 Tax=Haloplasma contractile SSD-17B TaxID=1033810 RepID=U2DQH6_9MOLU|nr:electron transfer flavoprotein subunit alpha/FixB family protein [Haloplasma contractile]ERJ10872.1 Electron transfer flavoprotein alpha-subunit [Haloplasma contractile SSD-17B]